MLDDACARVRAVRGGRRRGDRHAARAVARSRARRRRCAPNLPLADVYRRQLARLGLPETDHAPDASIGSSDITHVSRVVPTIHPNFPIGRELQLHTREFAEAATRAGGRRRPAGRRARARAHRARARARARDATAVGGRGRRNPGPALIAARESARGAAAGHSSGAGDDCDFAGLAPREVEGLAPRTGAPAGRSMRCRGAGWLERLARAGVRDRARARGVCARPAAPARARGAARPGLPRHRAADRRRADDLGAERGRGDDRGARPRGARDRARGRHRLGLPSGDPGAAGGARDLDRARAEARGARAPPRSIRSASTNVLVYLGDGSAAGPRTRRSTRSSSPPAGPTCPPPLLAQLAPGGRARGALRRARRAAALLRIRRVARDRFTREVIGRCRFVDLVGAHGWAA